MKSHTQNALMAVETGSVKRPPFRFWMTGCMAVVMSAFAGTHQARADSRGVISHASRFSVAETVQRIEASAQRHGLQMFALVDRRAHQSAPGVPEGTGWKVIVFATSEGGTPVVMDHAGDRPSVPMSLVVRENGRGGSEVLVASRNEGPALDGLPPHVRRDLEELPGLVAEALR